YIIHTLDFVSRELMHEHHGFYSAIDADSEGVEGKFYTYTKKELDTILEKDSEAFCKLYKVEATGNWPEGKEAVEPTNILWLDHFLSEEEKEVNNR
ncbi:hypothetical protein, partial [Enterococcus faecium]|uniref:hypothetical protein n=1 Tax=Enterococcus faecium TaxID=1352 RepID=UPI0034E96B61